LPAACLLERRRLTGSDTPSKALAVLCFPFGRSAVQVATRKIMVTHFGHLRLNLSIFIRVLVCRSAGTLITDCGIFWHPANPPMVSVSMGAFMGSTLLPVGLGIGITISFVQ